MAENPWLLDILGGDKAKIKGKHKNSGPGGEAVEKDNEPSDIDPDEVFDNLAAARAALVDNGEAIDIVHFSWNLRGGCWAPQNKGLDYDSCRASATSSIGKRFLRDHGLQQSTTFSIARFGEHACAVFCRYWCAKMKFLLQASTESRSSSDSAWGDKALSAFVEPREFSELADSAQLGSQVQARIKGLRALCLS